MSKALASSAAASPGTAPATFPATYAEARAAFLSAVEARGGRLDSQRHPGQGPEGEPLWLDAARFGAQTASRVFVVASGTHGIEGYAGSAVQTAWLAQGGPGALPDDVAVLLIHAINPWGFAHRQRVNEDNIDLNRNFLAHGRVTPPANPGYAELHPALSLNDWTEDEIARAFAALDAFRERSGEQAFSDAFNGGQYSHADGIFHGGDKPAWSNLAVRALLRRELGSARECVFVDLHTGIGPYGQPFLISVDAAGSAARERAIAIWGDEALSGKGSTHQKLATFQGLLLDAFATELPGCRVSAVAVEFGTHERRRMQRAHLTLMWLRRQAVETAVTARAREEYDEAFIPSDPAWRSSVMTQGVALCRRGLQAVLDTVPAGA